MNQKQERWVLFALAFVQLTHIMDFMIMMPLGPQLIRIFDLNASQFSLLVSAYTFSAGISGFAGVFWIDRFDRKTALTFNYCGFLLGTIACSFAPSYSLLMLARILTGFFGGLSGALILSIIGDIIPFERRGAAMGLVMSAFSVASVVGVPVGLYLSNLYGWHLPFIVIGLLGAPVLLVIRKFVPSLKEHIGKSSSHPLQNITTIFKDQNLVKALLLTVFLILGQFTVIPFISPYLTSNSGFSESNLPLIYFVGGLFSIFTAPLIGKLADKIGKQKVFAIFALVSISAIIMLTHLPVVPMAVVLSVTSLFFIASGGRMIPAQALITSAVASNIRGSFMSLNSSVQQLSSGLAAFIAGLIIVKPEGGGPLLHYDLVGYIAVLCSIMAIFMAFRIHTHASQLPNQK